MIAGSDIGNGCAKFADGKAFAVAEPRQQRAPGRIRQRGKGAVENFFVILNHKV